MAGLPLVLTGGKYVRNTKDYKVKMFHQRMGWGRGRFFLWFGYPIELIFYIEALLYITADIQSKRPFGAIVALPTTYIIIVSCWQHHQTKLPMAMLTNTCSLSSRYMISMQ
jgi:hypothetical protein